MNPAGAIAHFRRREMSLMSSACTITRGSGAPVWDPETGTYVDAQTTVYTGKCRLVAPNRTTSDVEAGNASYAITDYVVLLPIDTDVQVDDRISVDTSDDPTAAGLVLQVSAVPKGDWMVVREAHCQEFTQEPT